MKIKIGNVTTIEALLRDLSRIREDLFEMKITITPKGARAFNIAIGFSKDELEELKEAIIRELAKK